MSDKQVIINSLQKAERRIRLNALLRDVTYAFAVSLVLPLSFKILDLLSPFRAQTVLAVHAVWLAGFLAYVIWRVMQKNTLAHAAALIDAKAGLHDELKTAYWFINNPRPSEWVDAQIHRAAGRAQRLEMARLYPRSFPKMAYAGIGLFLLTAGLNFVPLPWNHNWLVLQAAPAYELSEQERALLEQTMELLERAEQLQQAAIADRLQEIVQQLQTGEIDAAAAAAQLQDIAGQLEADAVDLAEMFEGLSKIAEALEEAEELQEAAAALADQNLPSAADELQDLAERLDDVSRDAQNEVQAALEKAAQNEAPGLENLTNNLKEAAQDLQQRNPQGAGDALQSAAVDLQQLSQQLDRLQMMQQAGKALQGLSQAMMERLQRQEDLPQDENAQGTVEGGQMEGDAGAAQLPGGEKGSAPEPGQMGGAAMQGSIPGDGGGLEPSIPAGTTSQEEGPPTQLDVQLQKEELTGQHAEAGKPEDIEEASKQERSKLDYRNVESDLTPAQKDLLNQDRIPWEYRPLIKNYFQAIKPPKKPSQ
jgi:hypothetical protein